MIASLWKKKISEEKVANIFINTVFELVDKSFPDVTEVINSDPEFVKRPDIQPEQSDIFLLTIIAGNIKLLSKDFIEGKDDRIKEHIYAKLAKVFDVEENEIRHTIKEYHDYMAKINYPSKNVHYAMSKTIFFKYGLNEYQKEYFKNLNTPNPIFLKHLDELVEQFIINWEDFQEKYKITD